MNYLIWDAFHAIDFCLFLFRWANLCEVVKIRHQFCVKLWSSENKRKASRIIFILYGKNIWIFDIYIQIYRHSLQFIKPHGFRVRCSLSFENSNTKAYHTRNLYCHAWAMSAFWSLSLYCMYVYELWIASCHHKIYFNYFENCCETILVWHLISVWSTCLYRYF